MNFVFGAHSGFDPAWAERYCCIFVNLEQVGHGGAQLTPAYQALLQNAPVVDFDPDNVAAYAATGEPFGKAGGYGIQGPAGAFVQRIVGSHPAVMGLPLYETVQLLNGVGWRP